MRAWLQLLRIPNLFTVPGDVMAGMVLTALFKQDYALSPPTMIFSGAASLCFYGFGLLLNDLHDYRDDCRFRPERPLPAQNVSFPAVWLGMLFLLAAGAILSFAAIHTFINGLVLAVLIIAYNLISKRYIVPGCLNMGLCRGAGFLLGIPYSLWVSPLPYPVWGVSLGLSLYVAAVTFIAKREDVSIQHGRYIWVPSLLATGLLLFIWSLVVPEMSLHQFILPSALAALLFSLISLASCLYSGFILHQGVVLPEFTRREIGRLIRTLIFFQAACLFLLPSMLYPASLILLGWPLSQLWSRYIQSS